tara:strand:+ start:39 stop:239 length:201 start_codon:yes stop_codon:yes gene_type:complete
MIKIIIENEEEILGVKDKNAFTQDDAIQMFETILRKMFWVDESTDLKLIKRLPLTKIHNDAIEEGM